jgi:hypothetical protein
MDLVQSLLNLLRKGQKETKEDVPEGLCPNCWGRQEYGGKFFEASKNYDSDINSKNPKLGWIQEYANKHLLDIQLKKKDDQLICNKCKVNYRLDK